MYTEKDLEKIKQIFLKNVPGLKALVLFGSYARESAGGGSDLDIAAIVNERPQGAERRAVLNALYRALAEHGYIVDVLFKLEDEFELDKNIPVTMAHTIALEGKVLWTKKSA